MVRARLRRPHRRVRRHRRRPDRDPGSTAVAVGGPIWLVKRGRLVDGIPFGLAALTGLLLVVLAFGVPGVRSAHRRRRRRTARDPRASILVTFDLFAERARALGWGRRPDETVEEFRRRLISRRSTGCPRTDVGAPRLDGVGRRLRGPHAESRRCVPGGAKHRLAAAGVARGELVAPAPSQRLSMIGARPVRRTAGCRSRCALPARPGAPSRAAPPSP